MHFPYLLGSWALQESLFTWIWFRLGLSESVSSSLILKTSINLMPTESKKCSLARFWRYFTFLHREEKQKRHHDAVPHCDSILTGDLGHRHPWSWGDHTHPDWYWLVQLVLPHGSTQDVGALTCICATSACPQSAAQLPPTPPLAAVVSKNFQGHCLMVNLIFFTKGRALTSKNRKKSVKLLSLRYLVPSMIIKKPRPNSDFGVLPKTTWWWGCRTGLAVLHRNIWAKFKTLCSQADALPQTHIYSCV